MDEDEIGKSGCSHHISTEYTRSNASFLKIVSRLRDHFIDKLHAILFGEIIFHYAGIILFIALR